MRLAFYCPRRNWLKHYGPIIAAAKRRQWQTCLLIPAGVLATGKDDAHLDRAAMRRESGAWLSYAVTDRSRLQRHAIDWVVSVGLRLPRWLDIVRAESRHAGVRWASLDHIQESLLQILEDGRDILSGWDLVATGSAEGIETLVDLMNGAGQPGSLQVRNGLKAVGYPHLDPLAGMDQAACRAKWNLPAGRIVLLAPAARPALLNDFHWRCYASPIPSVGAFAWRLWSGEWLMPYREILRSFRRWADRHGAYVVAKVRDKTPSVHFLNGIADRVIGDEAFHPFTTLELCRAADAYIGLASAMAIEATAAGLPQIHVLAYPSKAYEVPAYLPLRRRFYTDASGLWQPDFFPVYDATEAKTFRLFCDLAPWADRSSGKPEDSDALARLAGPPTGRASERFLDLLQDST